MRLGGERSSSNVEDRRGMGGPLIMGGGIGGVILTVLYLLLGGNPSDVQQSGPPPTQPGQTANADDPGAQFVGKVLATTEDVWQKELPAQTGTQYVDPHLVLFTDYVQSGCGVAQSATGPFYCPEDQKVYIDLGFYRELKDRFGAGGDFAQAYVVAHEVGHHVQKLLGISDQVHNAQERSSRTEGNALSVRLELQADCLAGVWGHNEQQILDPGDVEEALNAASSIGDDRLQKMSRGYVSPESFTHGSSAQRQRWFRTGFESGQIRSCNTFDTPDL